MLDYRCFKEINELFNAGKGEQARRLLMELQSRYIALRDELETLQHRLLDMEDALFLSSHLSRDTRFYWLESNGIHLGPFCPNCYEGEGALIRLVKKGPMHVCKSCKSRYNEAAMENMGRHARILPFAR